VRVVQAHVVEEDVACVAGALPELVFLAAGGHAGRVRRDDERRDPLVALRRVHRRKAGEEAGVPRIGDPPLLSGEAPAVAVANDARLHAGDVRPGVGLAAGVADEAALLTETPEPFLLLRLAAGDHQRQRAQVVAHDAGGDRGAAVRQFFGHQAAVERVQADPAVGLGQLDVHQAELPCLLENGGRKLLLAVPVGGIGDETLGGEPPGRLDELVLLFGECRVEHNASRLAWRPALGHGRGRDGPPPARMRCVSVRPPAGDHDSARANCYIARMALLLGCQKIAKAYGAAPLFADLSFGIHDGDRIGLVGPNGCGKSTLLRVLAGIEAPDAGTVALRRLTRLAYVPQDPEFFRRPHGGGIARGRDCCRRPR